ncbi:carboxylate-amine ligase [Amycolatopsis xylanica]|uniref:Putative glutamate--cysteine ligase 2 n=1 Tax=Amycolatopsis xylanica TaxID=589385 RepID=A0A1H3JWY6_9PSEU|nr:glutamate--cysteine ligase [Amycolatopsis xylanica]SDY44015.1 carboxylate-amine ligase [Amycolatopsis xylanica]
MSEPLTFGVEEEFFVVDAAGHLSERGGEVVEDADEPDGELQKELTRAQAESATAICHSPDELLDQLKSLRAKLAGAAAKRGLRLLASGTAPLPESGPPGITPGARYQRMAEHFGATAHSGATCGCHVHVAIPDKEAGVRVINQVRRRLPALLALLANSPITDGADTGYSSWRYQQWTRWPSAGPPPRFSSLDHYESLIDGWLRAGAILDRGMVYWDVRLSDKQPTIEFRVTDVAAVPEDAALLAVLARGLVQTALNDEEALPELPNEVLRGHLWRASRDGAEGRIPHPVHGDLVPAPAVFDELFTHVSDALKAAGDHEFAEEGLARHRASGGGAQRQRDAFADGTNLCAVVDLLAVPPPS